MIDWLKKQLFAGPKTTSPNTFNEASDKPPAQTTLTELSVTHKKSGDAYFNQDKFSEAAACYREALTCNPDYAEALNNLSNACRELGLLEEAERCLRRAAAIKPLPNVHYNLASLLLEQGRIDESIENFSKEVAHNPKHYAALAIKLYQMQKICAWDDLESSAITLRHSVAASVDSPVAVFSPFAFITLPGTTSEEQKQCAEKWARSEYQHLIELRHQLGFNHNRPRNKKIVVGYLSGDFREHPVAKLMAEVFELHDHKQFRITAYSYGPDDGSDMRKRLERAFDEFVDLRGSSDLDCARRIYADNTDILVDLTGYTQNSRSGILALRPAPIQINYLGYPGTLGASFMDYIITDRFVTPPGMQAHFSEQFLYMPHSFMPANRTQKASQTSPSRRACGLPDHGFVFCCFNQSYKLTPQVFAVWMRLLQATPNSVLWLSDCSQTAKNNLRLEIVRQGVDPLRVVFAPRVATVAEHLARHQHADLFLDTQPYNAHTTCSDALWVGLPVITCSGDTFPSRVAGSLLSAIGLPELITYNLNDYYALALDLATNPSKLDSVRSKLVAHRDTAPLFDSTRFTRDLEHKYLELVEKCGKLGPT